MKTRLLLLLSLFTGLLNAQTIDLQLYAEGLNSPVDIAFANDDRMFVAEQGGKIKMIVHVEETNEITTFLNITSLVTQGGGERGLLGLAFHPDYENNGYFFVNYTNPDGDTVIARYTVSSTDPNMAEPTSAVILMTIPQPYSNHNGGCLRFGPDGYLYIGMGDGGSSGDPENRAQNINEKLGKMLRINVDSGTPYSIPDGNPYMGVDGADEIWAIGLRNPWKFSFDKTTGDLWIADVGQNQREEINHVASGMAGVNYGWKCYEGMSPYNLNACNGITGFTAPVAQYTHAENPDVCSITGGYVYRGTTFPAFQGKYFFSDYCSDKIGMLDASNNITWTEPFGGNNFTVFGEDITGELYVGGITSGNIYRIIDNDTSGTDDFVQNGARIYPNPAKGEVFVQLGDNDSNAAISIYDVRGKMLVQQNVTSANSRIDTSAFTSGMYLVKVETAGGTHTRKLIIN